MENKQLVKYNFKTKPKHQMDALDAPRQKYCTIYGDGYRQIKVLIDNIVHLYDRGEITADHCSQGVYRNWVERDQRLSR